MPVKTDGTTNPGTVVELGNSTQKVLDNLSNTFTQIHDAQLSQLEIAREYTKTMVDGANQVKNLDAEGRKAAFAQQEKNLKLLSEKQAQLERDNNTKILNQKLEDLKKQGLAAEEMAAREAEVRAEYQKKQEAINEKARKRNDKIEKKNKAAAKKATAEARKARKDKNLSPEERKAIRDDLIEEGGGGLKGTAKLIGGDILDGLDKLAGKWGDMVQKLNSSIDAQAGLKSSIDTRLQGFDGKHWDDMSKDLIKIAGTSPLVKQSEIQSKISDMVGKGIAFNVEQRAVLDVMKDKIATTFEATNATLTRLVRIQQQDTTAGRLGMESALTAFLNNMYQTTEYMEGIASQVKGNIEEAMALMSGSEAVSFEYQMQKWLGSMYSTGMSDQAVQGLAGTIGKLASGQIDAITGDGKGNLVVMAANDAGLSIADLMANGLDDSNTNRLMESMVNYLAKIYNEAGNSKVIQQQFAQVYGLSASDLKAIASLARSSSAVSGSSLSYDSAIKRLNDMAGSMAGRTSIGEMMQNAYENVEQSLARSISSNPALYGIYKGGKLLKDLTGGIDIPAIQAMGTGVSSGLGTVASLMMSGALAGGILSNIGAFASSLSTGLNGAAILKSIGVDKGISSVTRGTGTGITSSIGGNTLSMSGSYITNANGGDIQNKVITDRSDEVAAKVEAVAEESNETTVTTVDQHLLDVYKLLQDVIDGSSSFSVRVENEIFEKSSSWSL